jgi:broad specificity phosphatase PhoE
VILPWLRELNGCYDGKHWCWSLPGAESLNLASVPQDADWHTFPPFGAHMKPVLEELARQFEGLLAEYGYVREGLRYRVVQANDEVLALVCHGGLILTLLSYLFHWPLPLVYAHLWYDPTGLTRLRWETHDGYAVPRAKTLNDLAHLRFMAS